MNAVFADTFFYQALLDARDAAHGEALAQSKARFFCRMILCRPTTGAEVSGRRHRAHGQEFVGVERLDLRFPHDNHVQRLSHGVEHLKGVARVLPRGRGTAPWPWPRRHVAVGWRAGLR